MTGASLEALLDSVVALSARVPETAMTAEILGTERKGQGIVIGTDGLVLTIGYLVVEADQIWITNRAGDTVPAYCAGYDYETGFGLVRPLEPLSLPPLALGDSDELTTGDRVLVAGYGEPEDIVHARVITRREFAGYWEYVIDDAIYTAPAHPNWAGTGVVGHDGRLYGIGSLLVQRVDEQGSKDDANMHVPINLLKPILGELCEFGARTRAARPWLGFFVQETDEGFTVSGLYETGPAADAGLATGDLIVAVDGERPGSLAELFRHIWRLGPAGTAVPLTIERDAEAMLVTVVSADRTSLMRAGALH